jgi:hypothetical protein
MYESILEFEKSMFVPGPVEVATYLIAAQWLQVLQLSWM